jgi:hypothetical protein
MQSVNSAQSYICPEDNRTMRTIIICVELKIHAGKHLQVLPSQCEGHCASSYSLRPELDGPPAAQPIKQKFCKNPLPRTFLLPCGPKFEIRGQPRDGTELAPELVSRRSLRRSWARAGACAGAGLTPELAPELGSRRSWSRSPAGRPPPWTIFVRALPSPS